MSCTSKLKTEFGGSPLLPGSKAWQKHKDKQQWHRSLIDKAQKVVDNDPIPVNIRYEIDVFKMKTREQKLQKQELENRYMVNRLGQILRGKADTDHMLERPVISGSSYKVNARKKLEKTVKENQQIVLECDRVYSDYDHIQQATEWIHNRKKHHELTRYKQNLWKPVFEKQKRIQERRGRSLDPLYTFRFT